MKIGILTMHKVLNYGSALQAFALQHYIQSLGHEVELIDYIFPNIKKKSFWERLKIQIKYSISGKNNKKKKFQEFYNRFYNCSSLSYNSYDELMHAKFDYDVYFTGSDQVWNPLHIKDDDSFFLPFVPSDKPKFSYASSFSVAALPDSIKIKYRNYLSKYTRISVREQSGIENIKSLIDEDPDYVCDPTLLLTKDEWLDVAKEYTIKIIDKPYILVYILTYAYNPYPQIWDIVDEVHRKLGYQVIILDGPIGLKHMSGVHNIRNIGPLQFVNLIGNASFVITTSFHGTAFALNFNIPFFSVIKDRTGFDTRMLDLLNKVKLDRAIIYNKKIDKPLTCLEKNASRELLSFRQHSQLFLQQILK